MTPVTPGPAPVVGQCPSKKLAYANRNTAKDALRRSQHGPKGLRPYRCPDCPYWHLGHPRRKWWKR